MPKLVNSVRNRDAFMSGQKKIWCAIVLHLVKSYRIRRAGDGAGGTNRNEPLYGPTARRIIYIIILYVFALYRTKYRVACIRFRRDTYRCPGGIRIIRAYYTCTQYILCTYCIRLRVTLLLLPSNRK